MSLGSHEVAVSFDLRATAALYRTQEWLERPSLDAVIALGDPRSDDVVVDLGCGPAALGTHLERRRVPVASLVGVDRSTAMLQRARRRGHVETIRADLAHVPLPDSAADLVVCSWVLQLLGAGPRRDALREVRRLLASTGRGILVVPARPESVVGRVIRSTLRSTVASTTLAEVADLDAGVVDAGLVMVEEMQVGTRRWAYEARVVRVEIRP